MRVISQADSSLLPSYSGVYCFGGSWFLNDAANYLLAGVHGLPAAEVETLLVERIAREIVHVPAFNECSAPSARMVSCGWTQEG